MLSSPSRRSNQVLAYLHAPAALPIADVQAELSGNIAGSKENMCRMHPGTVQGLAGQGRCTSSIVAVTNSSPPIALLTPWRNARRSAKASARRQIEVVSQV